MVVWQFSPTTLTASAAVLQLGAATSEPCYKRCLQVNCAAYWWLNYPAALPFPVSRTNAPWGFYRVQPVA